MRSSRAVRVAVIVGAILGVATLVVVLASASHDGGRTTVRTSPPVAMFEEYGALKSHPDRTLRILRSLGVGVIRVLVIWNQVAADPQSLARPPGNPYPSRAWAVYDRIARDARHDGIEVDFLLTGGAPVWATAPDAPVSQRFTGAWNPSAAAYRDFVRAAAVRYTGHYTPPGASSPLPRVHFWEIWDEPNWGPTLRPQLALHPLRIVSAIEYRRLLDAAWTELERTGHGRDTIVIGNLSPRGTPVPPSSALAAAVDVSSPLGFTRVLYCVDSSYRPLRGPAADRADCPTSSAGSRQFRQAHPALFDATGYGIHPYPIGLPPTEADSTNPDTVEFSQIPHLVAALDRLRQLYDSPSLMNVYNTEYGYITNPPNPGTEYVSPTTAAGYLNWAEYLTWRNPQIASTMQYGLYDISVNETVFGRGGFATGLILDGKPKPTFYAYRMPLFLPVTRAARGHTLEVWGCARPAPYARLDTHRPQHVQIQFQPRSGHRFRTVKSVHLTVSQGCYFDVQVSFPTTGMVRLQWSYPRGDQRLRDPTQPRQTAIHSREVQVTIR